MGRAARARGGKFCTRLIESASQESLEVTEGFLVYRCGAAVRWVRMAPWVTPPIFRGIALFANGAIGNTYNLLLLLFDVFRLRYKC